jgi:signal transduction histidine kinase/CheY-like chemotaxis protein
VPLRTKKGINIGSVFALDDRVREPITEANRRFLATMAENILVHFENLKEKEDRKRALHMNMCLAAFVDPEHSVRKRKRTPPSRNGSKPRSRNSTATFRAEVAPEPSPLRAAHQRAVPESIASAHLENDTGDPPSPSDLSVDDSDCSSDQRVEEDDHMETYKRAADLLYDSLSLDGGGGVAFVDTTTSYLRSTSRVKTFEETSDDELLEQPSRYGCRTSLGNITLKSTNSWGRPQAGADSEVQNNRRKLVDILAMSRGSKCAPNRSPRADFTPLSQDDLSKLIKRHPRGKLFNLDPDGILGSNSSSEEYGSGNTYTIPRSKKITPSKTEAKLLFNHFPGARQVIFLPLWDTSCSRFSALFVYNSSDYRTFSNNPDFLYCIAFGNCVITEITRLATIAADQQKGDFIGSISHELRSPLHGILASCEFLDETETSSFQKSLVDTADSCARTLLDTINMVLDYSKINAFERNAEKARRNMRKRAHLDPSEAGASGHLQPSMSIYGDVDLAAITEEVVEGVATGQVFKDSLTGADVNEAIDVACQKSLSQDLEIILDISPRNSAKEWVFVTQPGAFRRIVMNVFGNALKYTRKGYICVKLEAKSVTPPPEGPSDSPTTLIQLTITDTGQGMSSNFLRTRLFLPFSQESSLSSGTGLGLSLVRSLVTMLNGDIDVQSTQGVGTQVTVRLPMTMSSPSNTSTSGSTPSSAGSVERVKDDSLLVVQQKAQGQKAMVFPPEVRGSMVDSRRMLRDAMTMYLKDWFGFQLTEGSSTKPDIIITEERYIQDLSKAFLNALDSSGGPMIVVVCTTASRRSDRSILARSSNVEAVSHPFGPYKLAKGLRRCLEKLEGIAILEEAAEPEATAAARRASTPGVEDVVHAVEQVILGDAENPDAPDVHVIQQGTVMANEESVHAPLVIDSAQASDTSQVSEQKNEYPFPAKFVVKKADEDGTISPSNLEATDGDRPTLKSRRTISPTRTNMTKTHIAAATATPTSRIGAITAAPVNAARVPSKAPRLLLVDDNKVNLRLLQTFMKKRAYTSTYTAEDGAQAVSVYSTLINSSPPAPPDVIFLDISMPIMDGFEACRTIRELEAEFRASFPPMQTPASSLIIALTGLASGRDRSEAFASGFDLYLVKPISFREVGRLLDNWEKNGGAATMGVPHGAVTGEDIVVV